MNTHSDFLIMADAESGVQAPAPSSGEAQAVMEVDGGAQAAPQQAQQSPSSPFSSMLILIPLFGLMYFLMIRPQRKRQKEMQAMQDTLKAGDKVMTVNGSIGTVSRVGERTVWISYGKFDVEYVRNAIAEVIKDQPVVHDDKPANDTTR